MNDAEKFKREREQAGFTQEQLAKALDTTIRTISRWETGKHKIPKAVKLACKTIYENN